MREKTRCEVDEPMSTPTLNTQIWSSSASVRPVDEKKIRSPSAPCSMMGIWIESPAARRVDGVTGPALAEGALVGDWVVVPQTDGVNKRSLASQLQASSRDDHDVLCRNRRVV